MSNTINIDINTATKNYKKIIDLGPYKGSGVGYDWVGACIKKSLSIICHMQPIKGGVLTKNFEN